MTKKRLFGWIGIPLLGIFLSVILTLAVMKAFVLLALPFIMWLIIGSLACFLESLIPDDLEKTILRSTKRD